MKKQTKNNLVSLVSLAVIIPTVLSGCSFFNKTSRISLAETSISTEQYNTYYHSIKKTLTSISKEIIKEKSSTLASLIPKDVEITNINGVYSSPFITMPFESLYKEINSAGNSLVYLTNIPQIMSFTDSLSFDIEVGINNELMDKFGISKNYMIKVEFIEPISTENITPKTILENLRNNIKTVYFIDRSIKNFSTNNKDIADAIEITNDTLQTLNNPDVLGVKIEKGIDGQVRTCDIVIQSQTDGKYTKKPISTIVFYSIKYDKKNKFSLNESTYYQLEGLDLKDEYSVFNINPNDYYKTDSDVELEDLEYDLSKNLFIIFNLDENNRITSQRSIIELLQKRGIDYKDGSNLTFNRLSDCSFMFDQKYDNSGKLIEAKILTIPQNGDIAMKYLFNNGKIEQDGTVFISKKFGIIDKDFVVLNIGNKPVILSKESDRISVRDTEYIKFEKGAPTLTKEQKNHRPTQSAPFLE